MREYIKAKSAIFRFQAAGDTLFINRDDRLLRRAVRRAPVKAQGAILPPGLEKIVDRNLGKHYRPAAGLAVAVARHFGVYAPAIRKTLASFRGLESRQEEIAVIRGVHFINDTTATIPEAAIAAIRRFRDLAGQKRRKRRLILIAGGSDKKLNFRQMALAMRKYVDYAVLLPGTATVKISQKLGKAHTALGRVQTARSMKEAVGKAYQAARSGDYILLSPGAASFGLFLNEFDRGRQFADKIRKLKH
jgi:UDP-N-acetylmuramoylalanine--D-glutamate ligase